MAHYNKAPKQWMLQSNATVTEYEAWKNNLLYTLSLDPVNKPFLENNVRWQKKSRTNPNRGFTDDGEDTPANARQTAVTKARALEMMLGQIANFSPINRATIVKSSTSLDTIWKALRQHLGFQANGARMLDLAAISLNPGERHEDLYQRLLAFMDDNLLKRDGDLTHWGEVITQDEEASPSLENVMVVMWLQLIHKDLPKLVKQKYGAELRSRTIASIKAEISAAMDSLIEEVHTNQDAKALRSVINSKDKEYKRRFSNPGTRASKECPLCRACKRDKANHFLSECRFLPEKDKMYLQDLKARVGKVDDDDDEEEEDDSESDKESCARSVDVQPRAVSRRVPVVASPYIDAYYKHHVIRVTVDSGATGNFIRFDIAKKTRVNIHKNTQKSHQADGTSHLKIVGEATVLLSFKGHELILRALVAEDLDDEVLGGTPFMEENDVWVRPKKKQLGIGESVYEYRIADEHRPSSKRVVAQVLRAPQAVTVWPGDYIELDVPSTYAGNHVALEPRLDTPINSKNGEGFWPPPQVIPTSLNSIRITNSSKVPQTLKKGEHFCQIRNIDTIDASDKSSDDSKPNKNLIVDNPYAFNNVIIDPQNITPQEFICKFGDSCESFGHLFNPKFKGFNGRDGAVKSVVNMGPVLPPQRKGKIPIYDKDRLNLLQDTYDGLEDLDVFAKPENVGVVVEYLNPSFLIKKPGGRGHRLVTDFGNVASYAKPQPSLMPDMDSVLRTIAQWKFIILTDLSKAYYQIPLDASSMKYCGVVTPFKGVRVYTRSAMGMPGSESALEEVMCRVVGNMIQDGHVVKLADNLYCGSNTLSGLCNVWENLLKALSRNNLHLSAEQTIINPKSTKILGWVWSQGTLTADPHAACTLQTCKRPETVSQLRSFIGAYKVLSRVIKHCSTILAPLDKLTAGKPSSEKLSWDNANTEAFNNAQKHVSNSSTISLPQRADKLWIITDASTKLPGIGATLYVEKPNKETVIGGFFSVKLSKNQIDWLPCEREALGIASAVKYFQPFITQSETTTTCLTDSKPCVQAFAKMKRGEFSASPRVSTFLSNCHRFQVSVQHIAGVNIALSDFQSRNPIECEDSNCQVCRFVNETENSVVRSVSIQEVISGKHKIPFLSRTAWQSTQLECSDLRRVHAHLKQATRPSRKQTDIRDVKRYLSSEVTIARDGLLVVRNDDPLSIVKERITIPRSVIHGLLSSLHLKLDHPTYHQLKLVAHRYFFALDMDKSVQEVSSSCHLCASVSTFKHLRQEQSTSDPPDGVCTQLASDVIRREKQYILALREEVTSYTWSLLIPSEEAESLKDALIKLCVHIKPMDGPEVVVRVDPAPGFLSLKEDKELKSYGIVLDLGRVKNVNKNPIAERAVQELELEIVKQYPSGGTISEKQLATATARLNSRIRSCGLSSREMLFQRDQMTNEQIPINDRELITQQHKAKLKNHPYSEKSKAPLRDYRMDALISVGDLVYLRADRDKTKARQRYLVVSLDNDWAYIRKFTGRTLRNVSYKIKRSECYKVPSTVSLDQSVLLQKDDEDSEMSTEPSSNPQDTAVFDPDVNTSNNAINSQFSDHNRSQDSLQANDELSHSVEESLTHPPTQEVSTRPVRNRVPPSKLSMKWDNTQSYD